MSRKIIYGFVLCLISVVSFGQSETHDFVTYDTVLWKIAGIGSPHSWAARISRPRNMFTPNHPDTASRPLFIQFLGQGETNADTTILKSYLTKFGPHYWITQGWDGGVQLGNGLHYPILITVASDAQNIPAAYLQQLVDTLRHRYHVKWNSIHLFGLSMGGYNITRLIQYAMAPNNFYAMQMIKSATCLEGNANNVYNTNSLPGTGSCDCTAAYPMFGYWAVHYGGNYVGLQGTSDAQKSYYPAKNISDSLAAAGLPNTAYFALENIGGGIHCCWNDMLDPNRRNWLTSSNTTTNATYPRQNGNMRNDESLFEHALRQGDTAIVGDDAPIVTTKPNFSINLPRQGFVYGSAKVKAGRSVQSAEWTQESGPTTAKINYRTSHGEPDLRFGVSAQHIFRYFTDTTEWKNQCTPNLLHDYRTNGVRSLRAAIDPSVLLQVNNPSVLNPAKLPMIKKLVQRMIDSGLVVVLGLFHTLSGNDSLMRKCAIDTLGYRQIMYQYYEAIANEFKTFPTDKLVHEIINEPSDYYPNTGANINISPNWVYSFEDSVIRHMHAVDSTHWITITGPRGDRNFDGLASTGYHGVTTIPKFPYTKLIYNFHMYTPYYGYVRQGNPANVIENCSKGTPYPAFFKCMAIPLACTNNFDAQEQYVQIGRYPANFVPGHPGNYEVSAIWYYSYKTLDSLMNLIQTLAINYDVPIWVGEGMYFVFIPGIDRVSRLNILTDSRTIFQKYNWGWNEWDPTGATTKFVTNYGPSYPATVSTFDNPWLVATNYLAQDSTSYQYGAPISNLEAGTYTFKLTVTDNTGAVSSSIVTVTVNSMQPPTVSAGQNQSIVTPDNDASLSGSAIGNRGATIVRTKWTIVSKPTGAANPAFVNADTVATTVTGLIQGSYVFRLTSTDYNRNSSFSDVTINVTNAGTPIGPKIIVAQGEYQAIFKDSTGKLWGISASPQNYGVVSGGVKGVTTLVPVTPSTTRFKYVASGLHMSAAVDSSGNIWTMGDNGWAQKGDNSIGGSSAPYKILVDSGGNPMRPVDYVVFGFSANVYSFTVAYKVGGDSIYMWGDLRGGVRGDGSPGASSPTGRPISIAVPFGKRVQYIIAGFGIIMHFTDGTVATWGYGGTTGPGNYENLGYIPTNSATDYLYAHLLNLTNVISIAGGEEWNYALCLVNNQKVLFKWGYLGAYMGAASNAIHFAQPTLDTDLMPFLPAPIKIIIVNSNSTHVILEDSTMYGWGNNDQGNIGNGKSINWMLATNPFAWNFNKSIIQVWERYPVLLTPGKKDWVWVFGATPFTFYTYALDVNGNLYCWGRDKSSPLALGQVPCSSSQDANMANSMDRNWPTLVNPWAVTSAVVTPSPYCPPNPTAATCVDCPIPAATPPMANAGADQNINAAEAILDGTASTDNVKVILYMWEMLDGPSPIQFETQGNPVTKIRGLTQGVYHIRLTVTDNYWSTATDDITIVVGTSQQTPVKGVIFKHQVIFK